MKLSSLITSNEKILYEGKPAKNVTILESIFNPMLPFSLLWFAFDSIAFGATLKTAEEMLVFVIPFLLLHMMPVWIYLGGIIFCIRRYKNTNYLITTKGIYISKGLFTFQYEMKSFQELGHISIHRGIIDGLLGTGDVIISCEHTGHQEKVSVHSSGFNICNISDYEKIFRLVKQLQEDIYSDTMFPNQYRPQTNTGYQTGYANPAIDSFLVDLDSDNSSGSTLHSDPYANRASMNSNQYANNNGMNSNPFANSNGMNSNPFANSNSMNSNSFANSNGMNSNAFSNNNGMNSNSYGNNNFVIDTFTS